MTPTPEQLAECPLCGSGDCFESSVLLQAKEIAKLKDDLQFVERWAVHHGTKPHMTAREALSTIQHYPPIRAITESYADGKVPDTFNPYAEIAQLKAKLAAPFTPITAEDITDEMAHAWAVAIATQFGLFTKPETDDRAIIAAAVNAWGANK